MDLDTSGEIFLNSFLQYTTRTLFERILLDHLRRDHIEVQSFINVGNFINDHRLEYQEIPDDFWEPVKVGLDKIYIDNFEILHSNCDCFICTNYVDYVIILPCCNKEMCITCINRWFKESVFCPYCKTDIRELYDIEESI